MSTQKGQSFIELLVAMGIFVLTSTAAILLFFGGQSLSIDSINAQSALDYASEGMEAVRSIKEQGDLGWTQLTDGEHGLVYSAGQWQLSGTQDTEDKFTRTVTVTTLSADTKEITTEIDWQTDPLRPQQIQLVMKLTNWEIVQEEDEDYGGDPPSGGSGTSGDWKYPVTFGTIDVGAGGQATDLDVVDKIIYLTSDASDSSKNDFFIFDATDPSHPSAVGWANTGSGLNAVDVAGDYAYAANESSTGQLQVIAISGSVVPQLRSTFRLQSTSPSCSSSVEGNTVFYYDQKVYVGTNGNSGKEFFIVDVSDPLNPAMVGCKEIGADVNAIYVKDDIAYLATSKSSQELIVLDASNPLSITTLDSFDAVFTGKSLFLVGTKLYIGTEGGFRVLDVSDPSDIKSLGYQLLYNSVNDLRVRDNLAFLATSDSNKEFQVWDVSSTTAMTLWSTYNFPQMGTGIDYENNLIYMSVRSNDALRIITSTPE